MRRTAARTIWLFALWGSGCGDLCGNKELSRVRSPDGIHAAVVFERNCGATTGFSTQVSIVSSRDSLSSEPGNIFIADTDHGAAPAAAWGGPDVQIQWGSNTQLTVSYHRGARVFRRATSHSGIEILYRSLTP
jgi:hypothetical protein